MIDKLTDMSIDWDGLSGGLECDLNMLVSDTEKLLDVNEERCVHDISFLLKNFRVHLLSE